MNATILSYRRARRTQTPNQILIKTEGISKKEDTTKLMGKRVVWTTKAGKKMVGTITKPHGRNGVVVARFAKGLPGQALGTKIEIVA